MSPELRDWLLDSPALRSVSTLALDAAVCGLIDLGPAIARAVSVEARMMTLDLPSLRGTRLRTYKAFWSKPPAPQVRIDGGVAVLEGGLGKGCAIRQTSRTATLDTPTTFPETLLSALSGRPLASLVSSPLLDCRDYVIASAVGTYAGTQLTFEVEAVLIERIRALIPSLSRGSSAPRGRGRGRSR